MSLLDLISAWRARRLQERQAREDAEFARGFRWAHEEIVFGRGLDATAAQTYGPLPPFVRGAHVAVAEHMRLRHLRDAE